MPSIKYIFFLLFIVIGLSAQAQIGWTEARAIAKQDSIGGKVVDKANGKTIVNNGNVLWYYTFSGGVCNSLYILYDRKQDYLMKNQLTQHGYYLNDDYEYQMGDRIATFKDVDAKYQQVVFEKTFKQKVKISIMDSIDKYLSMDTTTKKKSVIQDTSKRSVPTDTLMTEPIIEQPAKEEEPKKD